VKKGVFILLFICITYLGNAQISVLNGSFENHSFTSCDLDVLKYDWNTKMSFSHALDTIVMGIPINAPEFDLLTVICTNPAVIDTLPIAVDGDWYVGLQSSIFPGMGPFPDALTLELSDSLVVGQWYGVTYYHHSGEGVTLTSNYTTVYPARGKVGISLYADELGDSVFTSSYPINSWTQESFIFQASIPAKHLSYVGLRESGARWTIVDHFEIREVEAPPPSSISDYNFEPKLLRVVDMLGRKSEPKPNTPLFYIYGDGTVEKRITVE
jgi:hypothetical protein